MEKFDTVVAGILGKPRTDYSYSIDTRGYRFMRFAYSVDADGRLIDTPMVELSGSVKPGLAGRAWLRPSKRRRGK